MLARFTAALLIVVFALVGGGISPSPANAEPRGFRGRGRGRGQHNHYHYRSDNPWGGFWGGVLGGWLGSQATREREPEELAPWSEGWYEYCTRKYRSFDPETGTYLSYDGERKACR